MNELQKEAQAQDNTPIVSEHLSEITAKERQLAKSLYGDTIKQALGSFEVDDPSQTPVVIVHADRGMGKTGLLIPEMARQAKDKWGENKVLIVDLTGSRIGSRQYNQKGCREFFQDKIEKELESQKIEGKPGLLIIDEGGEAYLDKEIVPVLLNQTECLIITEGNPGYTAESFAQAVKNSNPDIELIAVNAQPLSTKEQLTQFYELWFKVKENSQYHSSLLLARKNPYFEQTLRLITEEFPTNLLPDFSLLFWAQTFHFITSRYADTIEPLNEKQINDLCWKIHSQLCHVCEVTPRPDLIQKLELEKLDNPLLNALKEIITEANRT